MKGSAKVNGSFFEHNTDIGQNFLRDPAVARWMVSRGNIREGDAVLEVGPGTGMLTSCILESPCSRLDAVELDTRLKLPLESIALADERLLLHWADAVTFDYTSLEARPAHIIANLPYHITTPLIWRLLESFSDGGRLHMLLMIQREAADRLTSGAAARASNPLAITLAALGKVVLGRKVPRGAFKPMPRVDSAIVEIDLPGARYELPNNPAWRRLLAASFGQRRKTLVNNWTSALGLSRDACIAILEAEALPFLSRPEEIALDAWLSLHKNPAIMNHIKKTHVPQGGNGS